MTPLSDHFTYEEGTFSETAERLSIPNVPGPQELWNMTTAAEQMERVRTLLGAPIVVTSWYRSPALNAAIGGSSKPQGHSSGYCIDFRAPRFGDPFAACNAILASDIKFDQIIYEGSWTHVGFHYDMRGEVWTARFHKGARTTYDSGIRR